MDEFDSCINIESSKKANDAYINVKELELDGNIKKIETPFKVLEGKSINQTTINSLGINKPTLFELSRVPTRYDSCKFLNDLITESVDNSLTGFNKFFQLKTDLYNSNFITTSLVFSRNPFKLNKWKYKGNLEEIKPITRNEFHVLLDYIHSSSSAFILVPDIKITKDTISINDYLDIIDDSVQILSERNSKPIFVPIQIQLKSKDLQKILRHYKNKGYVNLWINFNSRHIGGINFARVRTILRIIDQEIGLTNTVLYYSHMKKEVNPNINEITSVASDAISHFMGADFMGVNEARPAFFDNSVEEKINERIEAGEFEDKDSYDQARKLNSTRVFDPTSYYYVNLEEYPDNLPFNKGILIKNKEINKLVNSVILNKEVLHTKAFLRENNNVKPYLESKKCFNENNYILDLIIEKSRQAGILNYL